MTVSDEPTEVGGFAEFMKRPYMTPLVIGSVIHHLLTSHFAESDKLLHTALRPLRWTSDQRTAILISEQDLWSPEKRERRPAVLYRRNEYQSTKLGLGDVSGITETFDKEYERLIVGSHTVLCVSTISGGADLLGMEVFGHLTQSAPVVKHRFGLKLFDTISVGKVSRLIEATEYFVVPITVGWAFSYNWQLLGHDRVLHELRINLIKHC